MQLDKKDNSQYRFRYINENLHFTSKHEELAVGMCTSIL